MRRLWPLLVVLSVGGYLRLSDLDLVAFGSDQARASFLAVDMVRGHLAQAGIPSSLGTLNPPGFIWLLAPAAAISPHPLWLTAWIALLNLAGLGLAFLLARSAAAGLVDEEAAHRIGLASVALLAAAPYAVQYSRSVWAQDALPFFGCACALTLLRALRRQDNVALALSLALLSWMLQIHLSAAAFVIAWGLTLLVGMRRSLLPGLAVGVVLAAVLLVPFGAYEAQHGWADLGIPAHLPRGEAASGATGFGWAFSLTGSLRFASYFLGRDAVAFDAMHPGITLAASLLSGLLVLALAAGMAVLGVMARARSDGEATERAGRNPVLVLMGAWLLLPPLLLALRGLPIYPHYFIVSLPAQAFFVASAFAVGIPRLLPADRRGMVCPAFVAVVLVVGALYFGAFNQFLKAAPVRDTGDHRGTFGFLRDRIGEMVAAEGEEATARRLASFAWGSYILRYGGVTAPSAPLRLQGPSSSRSPSSTTPATPLMASPTPSSGGR